MSRPTFQDVLDFFNSIHIENPDDYERIIVEVPDVWFNDLLAEAFSDWSLPGLGDQYGWQAEVGFILKNRHNAFVIRIIGEQKGIGDDRVLAVWNEGEPMVWREDKLTVQDLVEFFKSVGVQDPDEYLQIWIEMCPEDYASIVEEIGDLNYMWWRDTYGFSIARERYLDDDLRLVLKAKVASSQRFVSEERDLAYLHKDNGFPWRKTEEEKPIEEKDFEPLTDKSFAYISSALDGLAEGVFRRFLEDLEELCGLTVKDLETDTLNLIKDMVWEQIYNISEDHDWLTFTDDAHAVLLNNLMVELQYKRDEEAAKQKEVDEVWKEVDEVEFLPVKLTNMKLTPQELEETIQESQEALKDHTGRSEKLHSFLTQTFGAEAANISDEEIKGLLEALMED